MELGTPSFGWRMEERSLIVYNHLGNVGVSSRKNVNQTKTSQDAVRPVLTAQWY